MNKIVIDKFFSKEEFDRKYTRIPFVLPKNVESFTLSYSYDKTKRTMPGMSGKELNAVDLALYAPENTFVGSSGGSKSIIYISEIYSSDGYKPIRPVEGTWEIQAGFSHMKSCGIDIHYEIEYTMKRARYLKGDCHLHTVHSDGSHTPVELVKKVQKQKLDYMIITDHNTYTSYANLPRKKDLCIIPGLELTCFQGHFNLLGAEIPIKNGYEFDTLDDLNELLSYAKEQGAVRSLNHPHCKNCGWHLPLTGFEHECVEVWNSPMRIDNMNTIHWWHDQLLSGRKLVAIGGSDYHRDYVVTNLLAMPCTVVYAESNTPSDVLDAIRKGHCYVTHNPKTSMLELRSGDAMTGDTVEWKKGATVTVKADKLKKGYHLVVYNNDKIILDRKSGGEEYFEATLEVKEKGFVRAEIIHTLNAFGVMGFHFGMSLMLPADKKAKVPPFVWALCNPIYFS